MPLILGANSVTGGYEVDNSLRFNSGSSDSLTKTTTTPDNRDKLTLSAWFKISSSSTSQEIFGFYGSNDYFTVRASNSNSIDVILYDGGTIGRLITTQLLRDFSAWYHIVVVIDTANATANDRMKIYLNGNEITSFSTRTNPSQNQDFILSTLTTTGIGINTDQLGDVSRFNGYISEAFYIDNQALDPTDFGEFDEDSGIWKPIAYTGTFGTAGFYLEFKDSSALGDDTSGNSNDFTVNNLTSIDQTTDTPTNNFATFNSLRSTASLVSFTEGNLKATALTDANTFFHTAYSSIGVTQGKWYAEFKCAVGGSPDNSILIAGGSFEYTQNSGNQNGSAVGITSYNGVGSFTVNTVGTSGLTTYTAGDIIGVHLNVDDNEISFYKNGVQVSTTRTLTTTASSGITYFIAIVRDFDGIKTSWEANFGNAPFTIASGNADANGYGNFEYSVPSGYYALCTNNLADYG